MNYMKNAITSKPIDYLDYCRAVGAEQHQLIQSALQGKELVNSHLRINPAFLLCLMNLILRKSISDQEWRFRVMHFHVAQHNVLICIGIAVAA